MELIKLISWEAIGNMWFWIGIVIFVLLSVIVEEKACAKYKSWVPKIVLVTLTFFASFRYDIVVDYAGYRQLFETVNWSTNIEPVFRLIVVGLRNCGFDYQMLFVVYSVLSALFLWKGLRYYLKSWEQLTMAVALFALFGDGGWWFSLAAIRQYLAVTVFIWGSRYIVEKKFWKYAAVVLLMSTIHYSSVLLICVYGVRYIYFGKKYYIGLAVAACIMAYHNLFQYIVEVMMRFSGYWRYHEYFQWGPSDLGSGVGILLMAIIWFMILHFRNSMDSRELVLSNLYLLGMFLAVISYASGPFFRIRTYFQFFGFMMLPIISERLFAYKKAFIYCILVLYTCMFLGHAYKIQFNTNPDMRNVKYEFNFKLLR